MTTDRPTGIIRTLPGEAKAYGFGPAREKMMRSYEALNRGLIDKIYVALAQRPKTLVSVLHVYILVGGGIICRMNIADIVSGEGWSLDCWDGVERTSSWWVVCSAPVSYPPEPIKMRGFQGFRYTGDLW